MSICKISVIGCGYWGKNLVRNFAELGALYSICDQNQKLCDEVAKIYGIKSHSLDELLQSDCEAVVIAAPATQHYELAKSALLAGKHVFVEKPLALKVQEAEELCDLASKLNKKLMVGHLLQYHPAFIKLQQMVKEDMLGDLQYIYSNRLNLGKFRAEENILWSFAPHDISMILSLIGSLPQTVYATGACHLNPDIHDVTTTHMNFEQGIQAHIFVSWLHPFKEQKLVVIGSKGMAVFDDGLNLQEKLKLYPNHVAWINGLPQPQKAEAICITLEALEPLKMECQHFIDCITQNHTPRTDGNEGIRVLQVLDAAQKSLNTNKLIYLNNLNSSLFFSHETSIIDNDCKIGIDTKIWHFSHILMGTTIGKNCTIAQNVMIGPDVVVGDNCKIQNNVSIYKGVILENDVFCGPSCVFTNVHNPRASIERKDEFRETYVEQGVTIGANATIICGNRLGAYSLIGAGAVVTKEVKPHAIVAGNPAKQIGWVSHAGEKLANDLICPREHRKYKIIDENLFEII